MIQVEAKIQVQQPQDNKSLAYITKIEPLKLCCFRIIVMVILCIFTAGILIPIILICVLMSPKLTRRFAFEGRQQREQKEIYYYFIEDSEQEEAIIKSQRLITNEAGLYWKVLAHKQRRYFLDIYQLVQQTFPHKAIQMIVPYSDPYDNLQGISIEKLDQLQSIYGPTVRYPNTVIQYVKHRFSMTILLLPLAFILSFFTKYWIPTLIIIILAIALFLVICALYYKNRNENLNSYTVLRSKIRQKILYSDLKVGDLVILNHKDINKVIDFKGLIIACKSDIVVNEQLYTGRFEHITKCKSIFNDGPMLVDYSSNSQMVASQINISFSANRIMQQNIIYEQSRIVSINDQEIGVVILNNNLIGNFYKAAIRKNSTFLIKIQKEYVILSGFLVSLTLIQTLTCFALMMIFCLLKQDLDLKAIIIDILQSLCMFLPLLLPLLYLFAQLAALIRLKSRYQSIKINNSQKIKEVGIAKHLYFGLRQTILVPRRLSFFLTMYQQKNVQYKSIEQFRQLFAHNDSIKSFQYSAGCCNDFFKVINQSQICQKIENNRTFQSNLFQDFKWKFKGINRQGNIQLQTGIYDDSEQEAINIELIHTHLISNETKGVRHTVLLKNEENFNFIVTKGDFYPGFQQILQYDQKDNYYDRAAQTLQKQGYLVEYICFKDYHAKKQNNSGIYQSRISNLKDTDIQSGFKFAGFCVSEQCMGQKRFDFLRNLSQYGYNIKIVTNDSKNTNFVKERFRQSKLKVGIMGKLDKQALNDVLCQDRTYKLMVGNGVYSQGGLYQSDISYAINPSQFENVCHVHFEGKFQYLKDLLAEGRCSLLMLLITIKIVMLREFGQLLGQIYLLSQNYSIEFSRNLVQDLLFLLIPMMLMNLPRPRNLNRYVPKQTLFSSLSSVEFGLSAFFLIGCFVSAYIYGSLSFNDPLHTNHLSYFHLGRIYFPSSARVHQPETMTVDMITNGFSIALLLTLDKRQFWRQWKKNIFLNNLVRLYSIGLWIIYNFIYVEKGQQNFDINRLRFVYIVDFFIVAMWTIDFFVDQKFQLAVKELDEIQQKSILIEDNQNSLLGSVSQRQDF